MQNTAAKTIGKNADASHNSGIDIFFKFIHIGIIFN